MKIDLQVKEKIEGIWPLIADTDFCISTLEQIYNNLSPDDKILFDKYNLLRKLRSLLWHSSILNLCTLFAEEEKYCIKCLLNIILNNYKRITFKNQLSIQEIKGLYEQIKPYEIYIHDIKKIRDISIAHKDNKKSFNTVMLYQLRNLISLAQEIFNSLNKALYNTDFLWDFQKDKRELSLIKNLTKFEILRNTIYKAKISNKSQIPISDLYSIVYRN